MSNNNNMRKPVANPLGGGRPAPVGGNNPLLPPLPFPSGGTMRPSTATPPLPPLPANHEPEAVEEEEYVSIVDQELARAENLYTEENYGSEEEYIDEEDDDDPELQGDDVTEDEDAYLRKIYLGSSDPAQPQTIYALANDDDWQVRDAVARNESTPEDVLIKLSGDRNDMVRQSVMENPIISDAFFANFANDPDPDVVISFIEHERSTPEMLRPLFRHADDDVIAYLKTSSKLTTADKIQIRK